MVPFCAFIYRGKFYLILENAISDSLIEVLTHMMGFHLEDIYHAMSRIISVNYFSDKDSGHDYTALCKTTHGANPPWAPTCY